MRVPFVIAIVLGLLCLLADVYVWRVLKHRCKRAWPGRAYVVIAAALYADVVIGLLLPWTTGDNGLLVAVNWMFFVFVTALVGKLFFIVFDLCANIPRLFGGKRWRVLSTTGLVVAVVAMCLMVWGALFNRYRLQTQEVTVEVANLPAQFDGLRIAQISDMHLGTYGNDTTFVARLISEVNALHPDVVFFTGDIVNRRSDEMTPFISTLSNLNAPMGVYAILGNHDYGDYSVWPDSDAKKRNMQLLYDCYEHTGWHLLRNQTAWLRKGRDSIAVIGVENIGDPPFHVYGNLAKAYPSLGDSHTKILLTHNPAHWVADISDNDSANVALTLSGHTHAMQIELLGLSPAAFRYKTWGGLYEDGSRRHPLYVNIGTGTVGLPARIGATPEITIITLKRKNN